MGGGSAHAFGVTAPEVATNLVMRGHARLTAGFLKTHRCSVTKLEVAEMESELVVSLGCANEPIRGIERRSVSVV